jgi:DNA-binding response OmpR family regulator
MARVLIVDDEEVARLTLGEILRLEGHFARLASSGEAAVEALREEPFDIMILDLKMTGMGGLDVLRSVMDSLPGLSVIILTAYGTIDSAIQAIRYQVHDYLLKPVSPEQVLASINRALERKSGQPAIAEDRKSYSGRLEALPGGAVLAWDTRQITWENGSLSLTPTEARLLKILFERRNEMVPHSELVYLIQGYQIETEEAAKILRPVVSRLRQKLSIVPEWGDRIKNVRGAGYVLELGGAGGAAWN